jgi:C1A family cysteine protease
MFTPDEKGIIHPNAAQAVGGHAVLINGVNMVKKLVRIKNSWGRSWGDNGHCWLSFADLDALLKDNGEALIATEVRI